MSDTYMVNEMFYSLQGEGMRAGTPNVFVRFTGCNMRCAMEEGEKSPGGFDCDTEFESGRKMTAEEIIDAANELWPHEVQQGAEAWMILTGGEPGLQVDEAFVEEAHRRGWKLAIETNGSVKLCEGLDWITVSPKVAEHAIKQRTADEVKYVRGYGQAIPKTVVKSDNKLISPAFDGGRVLMKTMAWCVELVKENPEWRLSQQLHKGWNVR